TPTTRSVASSGLLSSSRLLGPEQVAENRSLLKRSVVVQAFRPAEPGGPEGPHYKRNSLSSASSVVVLRRLEPLGGREHALDVRGVVEQRDGYPHARRGRTGAA